MMSPGWTEEEHRMIDAFVILVLDKLSYREIADLITTATILARCTSLPMAYHLGIMRPQ